MTKSAKVAALMCLGLASIVLWPRSIASAASKAGQATVVAPVDNSATAAPLGSGSATTPFSLQLPAGASCRGDSANDSYKVQSYMVPAGVDPATLQFGSVGPIPVATGSTFRQPLYDSNTNPFVNAQTAAAAHPHGPGPIINIPALNFGVFKAGDVQPGTYNIGVACTKGQASPSQLDTFWNAQMIVTSSAGTLTWSIPGVSSSGSGRERIVAPAADSGAGAPPREPVVSHDIQTVELRNTGTHAAAHGVPSGAPPSFGDPVAGIRSLVRLPDASSFGLAVWALIALVVIRLVVLMIRRPSRISMVAP